MGDVRAIDRVDPGDPIGPVHGSAGEMGLNVHGGAQSKSFRSNEKTQRKLESASCERKENKCS